MRILPLFLTGLALACVVVALTPLGRATDPAHDVVFLLDISRSVTGGRSSITHLGDALRPELEALPPSSRVWLVPFHGSVVTRLGESLPRGVAPHEARAGLDGAPRDGGGDSRHAWATRADLALDHAGTLLDDRSSGTVVLVSDGHPAAASVVDAARRLAARGHRVFTRAAPTAAPAGDLFLDRVEAPLAVRPGEVVRLRVRVAGTGGAARDFRLVVREAGVESDPEVRAARWNGRDPTVLGLRFAGRPGEGRRTFELRLEEPEGAPGGRETAGDRARVTVLVGTPVRVRWIGGAGGPPDAFRKLGSGFELVTDGRLTPRALATAEVVIVDDLPYGTGPLDRARVEALVNAVAAGTGFLAMGARRAFGPGGWAGSRLEPVLAVRPERPGPRVDTTLLLDASGSMAAGARWDRAAAAALAFIADLETGDGVRVVTFSATSVPVLPWRRVEPSGQESAGPIRDRVAAPLASRRPSGPTNLGLAVEEALRGFARVPAGKSVAGDPPRRRRLLLLSDGNLGEPESRFAELGRALAAARVRVGVVATGDALSPDGRRRLEALTRSGANGRIVRVAAGDDLRDAFREAGNPGWWRTGVLAVRASGARRPSDAPDVDAPYPAVGRLVTTTPRTDGATLLAVDAKEGLPVLAIGRHGDGRLAAFPISIGHSGSVGWNRAERWRPLLRWLARGAEGAGRPLARGRVRSGRLAVDVRLPAAAELGGWSYTTAHRGEEVRPRALRPVGGGRLTGGGSAPPPVVSTLTLWHHGRRVAIAPIQRDPGEELWRIGTNTAQLSAVAEAGAGRLIGEDGSGPSVASSIGDGRGGREDGPPAAIWAVLALVLFLAGRGIKVLAAPGR